MSLKKDINLTKEEANWLWYDLNDRYREETKRGIYDKKRISVMNKLEGVS